MAANTLNAEAAGQCFWGLVLHSSPARERHVAGQPDTQRGSDGWREWGNPSQPRNLPKTGVGGCEQVQQGPCWRDRLPTSLGPGWACPTTHLLCSLRVAVSLCWASGLRVGPATSAVPQGAGDNDQGPSYYFPGTCWVPGTVLRSFYQSGRNNKGTDNNNMNSKSCFPSAHEGWALTLLITPKAGLLLPSFHRE